MGMRMSILLQKIRSGQVFTDLEERKGGDLQSVERLIESWLAAQR